MRKIISALKKIVAQSMWHIYYKDPEESEDKQTLWGTYYTKEETDAILDKLKAKYPDLKFWSDEVEDVRLKELVPRLKTLPALVDFVNENPDKISMLTTEQISKLLSGDLSDIDVFKILSVIDIQKLGWTNLKYSVFDNEQIYAKISEMPDDIFCKFLFYAFMKLEDDDAVRHIAKYEDDLIKKSANNTGLQWRLARRYNAISNFKALNAFLPKMKSSIVVGENILDLDDILEIFSNADDENKLLDLFYPLLSVSEYIASVKKNDQSKALIKSFNKEFEPNKGLKFSYIEVALDIGANDLINEILPTLEIEDSEDIYDISDDLSSIFKAANEKNQKLEWFYLWDEEWGHPYILQAIKNRMEYAKDKEWTTKKLVDVIHEAIADGEEIAELTTEEDIDFFVKTPLWDCFDFSSNERFGYWYNLLKPEQKKKVCSSSFYVPRWTDWLAKNEPDFEDACLENELLNLGDMVNTFSSSKKVMKKLVTEYGISTVIGALIAEYGSNFLEKLKAAEIDISNLNYEEIYNELKKIVSNDRANKFAIFTGHMELIDIDDLIKTDFFDKSSKEDLVKFGNQVGVSRVLDLVKTSFNAVKSEALLTKFQDFFKQIDMTVEQLDTVFEVYTKIGYKKFQTFLMDLVKDFTKEDWKHFGNVKNVWLILRYYSFYDPKKFMQKMQSIFDGKDTVLSKFSEQSAKNMDLKYIVEFILKNLNRVTSGYEHQKDIINYFVTDILPDEYLSSTFAPVYYDEQMPFEKKKHYLDVMGDHLTPEQIKKILGKNYSKYPRFERPKDVPELPHKAVNEKGELLKLLLPLAKEKKAQAKLIVTPGTKEPSSPVKEMLKESMKDIPDEFILTFEDVKKTYPSLAEKLKELLFKNKKVLTVKELKLLVMGLEVEDEKFWLSEVPYTLIVQKKFNMTQVVIQYNFTDAMVNEIKKCESAYKYLAQVFAEKEGSQHPLSNHTFAWARVYKFSETWVIEEMQSDFIGWDNNFKSMTKSMEELLHKFTPEQQKEIMDFFNKHLKDWEKKFLSTLVQMARDNKVSVLALFDVSEKQGQQTSPSKLKWYYHTIPKSLGFIEDTLTVSGTPVKVWLKEI